MNEPVSGEKEGNSKHNGLNICWDATKEGTRRPKSQWIIHQMSQIVVGERYLHTEFPCISSFNLYNNQRIYFNCNYCWWRKWTVKSSHIAHNGHFIYSTTLTPKSKHLAKRILTPCKLRLNTRGPEWSEQKIWALLEYWKATERFWRSCTFYRSWLCRNRQETEVGKLNYRTYRMRFKIRVDSE